MRVWKGAVDDDSAHLFVKHSGKQIAILQTGRLGDLWFTLPLANHLSQEGHSVEIVYSAQYGNPFTFAPYVRPKPVVLKNHVPLKNRWGYAMNEAINQLQLYRRLRKDVGEVIWNQIFPCRWLKPHLRNKPFPVLWYEKYPGINFRTAPLTLVCSPGRNILIFNNSQSLRFNKDSNYADWFTTNLELLIKATGFEPLYVAFGNEPDHPKYRTWRGNLDSYQELIAQCGLVYGTSTSAHVLAQLLGKPFVVLYLNQKQMFNTIGDEDAKLFPYEKLTAEQLRLLQSKLR